MGRGTRDDEVERLGREVERLRAELDRARQGSAERFRRAFAAAPFFIALSRAEDGRWIDANDTFCRAAGFAREEVVGKTGPELGIWVEVSDREAAASAALGGTPGFREARVRARDGGERTVLLSAQRVDVDGEACLLWTGADITELRAAEEARRDVEAQLLRAQKLESLGLMAGGIAHDFNNILHGILGHAELLLADLGPGAPGSAMVEVIAAEARRAADLAGKMLAYSGRTPFAARPVDLGALVEALCVERQASAPPRVAIVCEAEAGLPGVEGDEAQLRQLVDALLANGVEALPERGGRVLATVAARRCRREDLASPSLDDRLPEGEYLVLAVEDGGVGMAPETRARAFDPFFTTKFVGRGLGLSVALGVARGHRGAVRLEGAPGGGKRAVVHLPVAASGAGELSARCPAEARAPGRRVLVIDDERSVRAVAERMLERSGYEVLTASDGREALEVVAREGRALGAALLDLSMPGLTGEATLREIAARAPWLPVIVSSAYAEDEVRARLGEPMPAFIQKPYGLGELLEVVGRAVETSPGGLTGRSASRGPSPG